MSTDGELDDLEVRIAFNQQMNPGRVCAACGDDQIEHAAACPECIPEGTKVPERPLWVDPLGLPLTDRDLDDLKGLWRS